MKVELQKFRYNAAKSKQDWIYFSADIYIDGVKAGAASNDGRGGPTEIIALPGTESLIEQAEKHFEALPTKNITLPNGRAFSVPQTLEGKIYDLALDIVNEKERIKYEERLSRDCLQHICVGTDNKYSMYKLPYYVMVLASDNTRLGKEGPEYLLNRLRQIKEEMKPGERILNDNIPAKILHQVFPPKKPEAANESK